MNHRKVFSLIFSFVFSVAIYAQNSGLPVETRSPEAKGQTPAFAGQTRVPGIQGTVKFTTVVVAQGLEFPWGLSFLPDGRMLVTERPGRLRIVSMDGTLSAPVKGVPVVVSGGQAGLLDIALDPDFSSNRRIYLSYIEPRSNGSGVSVFRGRLVESAGGGSLADGVVIYRADAGSGSANFGSRLLFDSIGRLFVTVGDRFSLRDQAQSSASSIGKIIRITTDGAPAQGNAFAANTGAKNEIWSMGHRNPQGLAFDAAGQLWSVEHGARGVDELNRVLLGKNYGWPVISYGVEYSGAVIGAGITQKAGMEQPVYYWDPVIAPSGMVFYEGKLFPAWKGNLFVGGLRGMHLVRLTMDNGRVTGEERLLTDLKERIRDVRVGPEGAIYLLTDNASGRIIKLVPQK